MSKIEIHAGDFPKGEATFIFGNIAMPWKLGRRLEQERVVLKEQLLSIEAASEESVKKVGGTLGWGIAGAALLGPVGMLAGLLAGGRGKNVTFVAQFKDGRKMLATTDSKTFTKMQAIVF